MSKTGKPLLSIVTVVYSDPDGLVRTVESASGLPLDSAEMWIINGSSDERARDRTRSIASPSIHKVIEPDDGIYDAMNKGAARATGSYISMNAGDTFAPNFGEHFTTLASAMRRPDSSSSSECVIIGYGIESYAEDYYLRPNVGEESKSLCSPMHHATFYRREVFSKWNFDTTTPIGADGALTHLALQYFGGVFIPIVVCIFELGGASSSYENMNVLRSRWAEKSARGKAKLVTKTISHRLFSRQSFYRILALRKGDRLAGPPPDVTAGISNHLARSQVA